MTKSLRVVVDGAAPLGQQIGTTNKTKHSPANWTDHHAAQNLK